MQHRVGAELEAVTGRARDRRERRAGGVRSRPTITVSRYLEYLVPKLPFGNAVRETPFRTYFTYAGR